MLACQQKKHSQKMPAFQFADVPTTFKPATEKQYRVCLTTLAGLGFETVNDLLTKREMVVEACHMRWNLNQVRNVLCAILWQVPADAPERDYYRKEMLRIVKVLKEQKVEVPKEPKPVLKKKPETRSYYIESTSPFRLVLTDKPKNEVEWETIMKIVDSASVLAKYAPESK